MKSTTDKKNEQYRCIHTLVHLLGMNDDAYRDMLFDRYGVRSSKQLSSLQRNSLIRQLRQQVHGEASQFSNFANRAKHKATPAQLRAIEAMWSQVSRAETLEARRSALNAFCKRLTGIDMIIWISKEDAKILINAMQAMGAQSPEKFNQTKQLNQR